MASNETDFLLRLHKISYQPTGAAAPILANVTFEVRAGDRLFILGPKGSGKSVLIKLISGELVPTSGTIIRRGRMSFPLGQLPFFVPTAALCDYVNHVARTYGGDVDEVGAYFQKLAQPLFDPRQTLGSLLAKDRQILSIFIGLVIPFDVYILDDYSPFLHASNDLSDVLEQRTRTSAMLFSTRLAHGIRDHATRIGVISGGSVCVYDTFLDGLRAFRASTASQPHLYLQP